MEKIHRTADEKKQHYELMRLGEVIILFAQDKSFRSPWNLNEGKAWVNNARVMKREPRASWQK